MASDYPGAIDGLAATHADIEDSVLAVQGELGVNPSGAAATVAARLAALDSTVDGKAATGAAVTDGQIPATIARDTEVAAAVTAHEGAEDPHPGYLLETTATATYLSIAPGAGLTEGATKAELDAAVLAGGGLPTGDPAGSVLVSDGTEYLPVLPTEVVAVDIPFTPTGTLAATDVQAAVTEAATEAAAALTAHEAAENPHPIYLTQAEADALYSGGGGGSAITVQDEGSPLTTAATTINFVGDGVTASGAGATKTVTIPGGGGGGSTTPTTAKITNSAIQSIPNSGSGTVVTLGTTVYNVGGLAGVNANALTVPSGKAGVYRITAQLAYGANATGLRTMALLVNGVVVLDLDRPPISGVVPQLSATIDRLLAVGDIVTLRAFQNSGVALDVQSGETRTALSMTYVGPTA